MVVFSEQYKEIQSKKKIIMNKEQEFELQKSKISNEELIELAHKEIGELAKTYGKSHKMSIPPRITDTDMLLTEVVKRFEGAQSQTESLKKEIEELRKKVESLQYSEAMAGVHIYNLECERSLYMSIAEALTDELKNDIDGVMDSCSINGEVEIVKEEDVPTDNIQNEDWGIFKDIRIDQWGVGDSGDSFEGLIYARIDHKEKKTWLKIPYNC